MKKTLLLSVVASTLIMAGGDIEPVAVPVVEEVSAWDFSGQGVLYYQTRDVWGNGNLFEQASPGVRVGSSQANVGLQLAAVNKDLFWGLGMGVELSGLGTLGLEEEIVNAPMQLAQDGELNAAEFTQAYLTYGLGNTSLKVGRQHLPKGLSPFAFTEGWNVFKNSFEAALLVNTDISDTVLVGAYVTRSNGVLHVDGKNLGAWTDINDDGVWMATIANKSIENLALTGTWYYAQDYLVIEDVNILWGDAKYNFGENMYGLVLGLQGGVVMGPDDLNVPGVSDTTGWGAKIGGNFEYFDASIAYSSVDDGAANIHNLGTGVKTPLYTQMIFNQNTIKRDSDTFVIKAGIKGLGGKFGIGYNYSDLGATALPAVTGLNFGSGEYQELDLTYKVKVLDDTTTLFAGYIYQNDQRDAKTVAGVDIAATDFDQNMLRFWARYNF